MKITNENYQNYSIKKKLLLSHGVILALSVIITIILLGGMIGIKHTVDDLYEKPMKNIEAIGDVRYGVNDVLRAMDRIIAEHKRDPKEAYELMQKDVERDVQIIQEATAVLGKNLLTKEGKDILKQITDAIEEGEKIRPDVMEALKDSSSDEAYTLCFEKFLPKVQGVDMLADELENQVRETAEEYYHSARNESIILIIIGVVLVIAGITMAIAVTLQITERIVDPIKQITVAAEHLRQGNLSAGNDIKYEAKDEIGIVAKSLREAMEILRDYIDEISGSLSEIARGDLTRDSSEITDFLGDFSDIKESMLYIMKNFNSTLSEIQNSSDQVARNSSEIAGASQSLSEGAMDQASSIEELTATIATVANLAEESAKTTQSAYENIKESADKAELEKQKMAELTAEMERITEISKEIENIITAIEDIASQTNLLSLNASIEAARAGEAGKGFAVVADQIGRLASDSAESAVNTRELIQKTLEEIEKGNKITASTSATFGKVIDDMGQFAQAARQASESANSQSEALEQIEEGIDQIAEIVQNTAASSEETSAISENLSNEAKSLDKLVKQFKLY